MRITPTELLRAPFELPARALENLETIASTARVLPATLDTALAELATLVVLLRELHQRVAGLGVSVAALDVRVAVVERATARVVPTVAALDRRLAVLGPVAADLAAVRADVHAALELLPDPDEPGPLERVRNALTGDGDTPPRPDRRPTTRERQP